MSIDPFMIQIREMAELAKNAGLNIDYFPTNFVVQDNLIYSFYFDVCCIIWPCIQKVQAAADGAPLL